ncbi:GIY-YIG catalytic domain-containing protein [Phlyctema vagabunda]|uniref:GIY-YIG catalytic domain-containing protein n=1 Tax=Phlyctema vagabunda TaxID=108571 RepID=A0ABR4PIE3_9HELO
MVRIHHHCTLQHNTTNITTMPLDRPIPAFYCCYLLRSTVSKSSTLYIGSTPNPVRRLRQHNGIAKGGAVRTSRKSLRPWEMTCIVTGFPSHIAALQFEWAWQNPHITQHIPADSRLTVATQKKRSGHPKRPRLSMTSGLSNLHLLLRVPSFARWPLEVRFFSEDVHKAWSRWMRDCPDVLPDSTAIITDFPSKAPTPIEEPMSPTSKKRKLDYGIEALPIDYKNHKSHVEKAKVAIEFEQEGSCAICAATLEHDEGIYTICPNMDCNAVTHLTCLGQHFLFNDDDGGEALVPQSGRCPKCNTQQQWIDIVKELSLRTRGQKEVEKLLKVRKVRKAKTAISASQPPEEESESEEDEENSEELERLEDELRLLQTRNPELGDSYLDGAASDESDNESVAGTAKPSKIPKAQETKRPMATVIEDSDWDEAEVLD